MDENKFSFENEEYRRTYWHTCSHILAQAVKRLYPEVKLAIGPSIDNGFYYDMDSPFPFTPEIMENIEAEMRDFDRAVAAAMDFADRHPGTLVVVTADHETGGLSIPSADVDFEHEEAGIEYRFSTGGHTAAMVPVYLYGTGAERINGVLDNTELALRLAGTLGLR